MKKNLISLIISLALIQGLSGFESGLPGLSTPEEKYQIEVTRLMQKFNEGRSILLNLSDIEDLPYALETYNEIRTLLNQIDVRDYQDNVNALRVLNQVLEILMRVTFPEQEERPLKNPQERQALHSVLLKDALQKLREMIKNRPLREKSKVEEKPHFTKIEKSTERYEKPANVGEQFLRNAAVAQALLKRAGYSVTNRGVYPFYRHR